MVITILLELEWFRQQKMGFAKDHKPWTIEDWSHLLWRAHSLSFPITRLSNNKMESWRGLELKGSLTNCKIWWRICDLGVLQQDSNREDFCLCWRHESSNGKLILEENLFPSALTLFLTLRIGFSSKTMLCATQPGQSRYRWRTTRSRPCYGKPNF